MKRVFTIIDYALRENGKIIFFAAIAVLLVAAIFLFYFFDPSRVSFFPRCPFLMVTGCECPGCGSQRAIHDALHLDFQAAFKHNALILFLAPYVLLGVFLQLFNAGGRFQKIENIFFGKRAALVVVSAIILYWIGRNVF